jgi:hypothetical protein
MCTRNNDESEAENVHDVKTGSIMTTKMEIITTKDTVNIVMNVEKTMTMMNMKAIAMMIMKMEMIKMVSYS